jgi:hypothetical protein
VTYLLSFQMAVNNTTGLVTNGFSVVKTFGKLNHGLENLQPVSEYYICATEDESERTRTLTNSGLA